MSESVPLGMDKGNPTESRREERKQEFFSGRREGKLSLAPVAPDSKAKLQPELHLAGAPRSEDRVTVDDIRRAASAAERMADRGVVTDVRANCAAVRIGEVGAIEQIKELHAKLGAQPFMKREGLEYGEVHVLEARIAEEVASHGAKGSKHRRNQDGVTLHVAA